ncbi:uncharacterized protein LOC124367128 [Homalodisca vitripennis]|uniref:uncharacterized protein LOC124367128 n=1 Tax=Homalodisca vitripennis TaxID=197043 RepID=UPI001EE9F0D3|nr:uncharacterized protein LOC124367128 [Homalodisca vitripennis]
MKIWRVRLRKSYSQIHIPRLLTPLQKMKKLFSCFTERWQMSGKILFPSQDSETETPKNRHMLKCAEKTSHGETTNTGNDHPSTSDHNYHQLPVADTIPTEDNRKSRKRQRNVQNWKQNVRKRLRNSGKQYTTRKGNVIEAKSFCTW